MSLPPPRSLWCSFRFRHVEVRITSKLQDIKAQRGWEFDERSAAHPRCTGLLSVPRLKPAAERGIRSYAQAPNRLNQSTMRLAHPV